MIESLIQSLSILFHRRTWGILVITIITALSLFTGLAVAVWLLLSSITFFDIGWLESTIDWAGTGAIFLLSWILFPAIQPLFLAFFLETIAKEVEEEYYPSHAKAIELPMKDTIIAGIKLSLLSLGLNILALPFYFIPLINVMVYYSLNGYLLGREYMELVSMRHHSVADSKQLFQKKKGTLMIIGAWFTFLLTIPFVNLFAPLYNTACMVHFYHKRLRHLISETKTVT